MLTARELHVVALLAQGCNYAQIGELLGISSHTVASHIKNLYRKLDVHSAAAAVMRAVELQVLALQLAAPASSGSRGAGRLRDKTRNIGRRNVGLFVADLRDNAHAAGPVSPDRGISRRAIRL